MKILALRNDTSPAPGGGSAVTGVFVTVESDGEKITVLIPGTSLAALAGMTQAEAARLIADAADDVIAATPRHPLIGVEIDLPSEQQARSRIASLSDSTLSALRAVDTSKIEEPTLRMFAEIAKAALTGEASPGEFSVVQTEGVR